jgi:hypothetical protein
MNASSLVAAALGPCAQRRWLPEVGDRPNEQASRLSCDVVGPGEINPITRKRKRLSPRWGGSKDGCEPMAPLARRPALHFIPQAWVATKPTS